MFLSFNHSDVANQYGRKRARGDEEEADELNNLIEEARDDAAELMNLPEPEEKEHFETCMLPSRKRERRILGKHTDTDTCFFCAYIGERDTATPSDDVDKLVTFLRDNTGRMKSRILAEELADQYADLRRKVNANITPGERELPYMSAATVLAHIRTHHQDPEVKQVVILEELQEIREELMGMVFEKSNKTKQKRVKKEVIDAIDKIVKTELQVQRVDASKMAFYSAGARVNPNTLKQGPVAHANKTLLNWFQQHQ